MAERHKSRVELKAERARAEKMKYWGATSDRQKEEDKIYKEHLNKERKNAPPKPIDYKDCVDRGYMSYDEDEEVIFTNRELTIIIPNKVGQNPFLTLNSLAKSTYKDFELYVIGDYEKNACKARNRGFKYVSSPYVLFSDNDLNWYPNSIELMMKCLKEHPKESFVYGSFKINEVSGHKETVHYNKDLLKNQNWITGNSIIRTEHFPGWDKNLTRLQDWDDWITMMEQGHTGIFCEKEVFQTPDRPDGITNDTLPLKEAMRIVKNKHGLK